MAGVNVESILEAEGHLVDSQILTTIFDAVIRHDSAFEVQRSTSAAPTTTTRACA